MSKLSLEEIGARAGVSRSTVSRVVNGEPNVSAAVRARVQKVIAETGYRPHAAAKSLASRRTGVIGLVIPSSVETLFDDPYFGRLVVGVSGGANEAELTLALLLADDQENLVTRVVTPGLVDGVVVTATHRHEPVIAALQTSGVPFVVVGQPDVEVLATVDVDNRGGAQKAVQHLFELGRANPVMIAAPSDSASANQRREGFEQAVRDAGLEVEGRVATGDWSQDSGQRAMAELLRQRPKAQRPDAVFVASDRMAIGALRAIEAAGLRCPDDVALVSFDGLVPPNQTRPSLTAMTQPVNRVGARAVRLLREVIDGDVTTPQNVVFATELTIRESCGAARAAA